jgi:hypothetical protein
MATTQITVCNQALDMIGSAAIATIADANVRAEVCARAFPQAVDRVLRDFPFDFAKKRVALVAAAAVMGWTNAYTLPTDFVSLRQLNDIEIPDEPGDYYEIQGTLLLTDEVTANIKYVRRPVAATAWDLTAMLAVADPEFVDLLATLLASRIAPALRADGTSEALKFLQLYEQGLAALKAKEGDERKSVRYDPATQAAQLLVCNQALDLLGEDPIASLTEANPRADAANRNFTQTLVRVLREAYWNFAKYRATLVAAANPSFGWARAFTLPADFVSFFQLNGTDGWPGDYYEIEGGLLFTDETAADIQYIRKPTAAGPWTVASMLAVADPIFVDLVALLLAAKMAPILRKDAVESVKKDGTQVLRKDGTQEALRLMQLYAQTLTAAKMKDANERKAVRYDPASESRFVASRYLRT